MSLYTIMLCNIDTCSCKKAARKLAKRVGKGSGCENRGLHCVYRQKNSCIQTESLWKCVLRINAHQAVHSSVFLYFTDLPACDFEYHLYSRRAGLHNSVRYSASPLQTHWCKNLSFTGKRPVWIKSPLTQIQYLWVSARFSLSWSQISDQ